MKEPNVIRIYRRYKKIPNWFFDYVGTINKDAFQHKGKVYLPERLLFTAPTARKSKDGKFWDLNIDLLIKAGSWNALPNVYTANNWSGLVANSWSEF